MSRLLCLLAISSVAGCGDDSCGSPGSAGFGLVASSDQVSLVYGGLTASANNDCPASDAPSGVVSVTINGAQMTTTNPGLITLCIPRPDKLNATVQLGTDVKIVDLTGSDATCTYALTSQPPTGTVEGVGVCSNGVDKAGYGLVFNGFVGLTRTCQTQSDTVSVGLTGNVAVSAN